MRADRIYLERKFYLGCVGPRDHSETATIGIEYSLEGETIEEAEQIIMPRLYEIAERERKRRQAYMQTCRQRKLDEERKRKATLEKTKMEVHATSLTLKQRALRRIDPMDGGPIA